METHNKKQYWYVVERNVCVLCGHEDSVRYRVYEKPKLEEKDIWKEKACSEHFM